MRLQVRERNESAFSATADVPAVIALRAERRLRVCPLARQKQTFQIQHFANER